MADQSRFYLLVLLALFVLSVSNFAADETPTRAELDRDPHFSFVKVEPGTFTMGSPPEEQARFGQIEDELAHDVAITKEFEIGKFEVTQGIWKTVRRLSNQDPLLPRGLLKNDDNLPVTHVNWNDVQEFMTALNTLRKGDGYTYRLPTEAEWEYSARSAQNAPTPKERQSAFSFGETDREINDYARSWNNSKAGVQPVGSRKANRLGLFDMHGNVWEWTFDKFTSDPSKVPVDPIFGHPVNQSVEGSYRVLRGGSFNNTPKYLRSASRAQSTPDVDCEYIGFRIVRQRSLP